MKRIMLIGLGPHAKRIYFPLCKQFSKSKNFELVQIVDLERKREDLEKYLQEKGFKVDLYLIPNEKRSYNTLNFEVKRELDRIIIEKKIDGVIISTEPRMHKIYAKWALRNNLSILMDKPISTYENVSTDIHKARQLLEDFEELEILYKEARLRDPGLTFSIMSQRRFHPSYQKMKELIKDVFIKTNCPITSIESSYSDGEWRTPAEIVEQSYHPYNEGHGVCSHGGYHFFDLVSFLIVAGLSKEKHYDNVEVVTKLVRPLDLLEQISLKDYKNIFGKEFSEKYDHNDLKDKLSKAGEVDAFTTICFKKKDKIVTIATINLIHNGFSKRSWVSSKGRDLYKGNGRVRHETHIIKQGPFQAINYHSYQSKQVHPNMKENLYKIGGEYHSDIYVFRNPLVKGKEMEIISVKDLFIPVLSGKSRGHQEDARARGFLEFVEALNGLRKRDKLSSDFSLHRGAVMIHSAIYQSAAAQWTNNNPVINLKFNDGEDFCV